MIPTQFRVPMVVYVPSPRGFVLISTMAEASDFLFSHWAENDSKAWTDAMDSCGGSDKADVASKAFLTALTGAGIRVDPTVALY